MGRKTLMARVDSKLKDNDLFKQLEGKVREQWTLFVDVISEQCGREWPGKEFKAGSDWHQSVDDFLEDCEDKEFNPFESSGRGVAQGPGDGDLRSMDIFLSKAWKSGKTVFCDRIGKALTRSEFMKEIADSLSRSAKKCAEETAQELGSSLTAEQRAKLSNTVQDQVKRRIKDLSTELKDFLRAPDAGYAEALNTLLVSVRGDGSRSLEKMTEIFLGQDKQTRTPMEAFTASCRDFLVQKLRSAFKVTPVVPEQARLSRQRSRVDAPGEPAQESVAIGEQCTIGDKFLGILGVSTRWMTVKKGKHADVSREICKKVLEEVDPWKLVSRSTESVRQISAALALVRSLLEGLNATLDGWSAGRDGKQLVDVGREMTERFMALRQAEDLANSSGTGQSLLSLSQHSARVDTTPILNESVDGGYVPFDMSKDLKKASSAKLRPQLLKKLDGLAEKHNLRRTAWRRQDANQHQLLHVYGQLLGLGEEEAVVQMRTAVAQMAFRDLPSQSRMAIARREEIRREHKKSVEEYAEGMRKGTVPADVIALTYLVDFFGRPLNLYVSWSKNPLRIMPVSLHEQEDSEMCPEADAFMYLGREQVYSATAEGSDDDDGVGPREPSAVFHFIRCESLHEAMPSPGERSEPEEGAASLQTAGWSAVRDAAEDDDDDPEQNVPDGWGLLRHRLHQHTNYELEDVDRKGHCQYDAIANQIRTRFAADYPDMSQYTWQHVRRDLACWLRENRSWTLENGTRLEQFLDNDDGWFEQFCNDVEDLDGKAKWGGHITLIAAANRYKRTVRVWSTRRTDRMLEIKPTVAANSDTEPPFELGLQPENGNGEGHYMSIRERFGSALIGVLALPPSLSSHAPVTSPMSLQWSARSSSPRSNKSAQTLPWADSMQTAPAAANLKEDTDMEEGEIRMTEGDADVSAPNMMTADDYRYATFNPKEWEKPRGGQEVYRWKRDKAFRLSPEHFSELANRFPGFTERWVFLRGKVKKNYSQLNSHGYLTKYLSYDDAIAHLVGCAVVLDGVGEGHHQSGSFARILAKHVVDRSQQPVPTQEIGSSEYNRSWRLLKLAHEDACRNFVHDRAASSPEAQAPILDPMTKKFRKLEPSTTAVILTLLRHGGRQVLHWFVHGDSQWALLRKDRSSPTRYRLEHLSEPTIRGEVSRPRPFGLRGTMTLKQPYQIGLQARSFTHDKPRDPTLITGCMEVEDGDLIVAGTDGFFDNFEDDGDVRPQRLVLEAMCSEAATNVAQENGPRHITEAVGQLLQKRSLNFMQRGSSKKDDDITIFVGKVSLGLPPGDEIPRNKGSVEPWTSHGQKAAAGFEELRVWRPPRKVPGKPRV